MIKKKIGFLSFWGNTRGLPYITLAYVKMLQGEYDIHILKQGTNEINPEFKTVDVNITEVPNYNVDKEVFKKWIVDNKIDVCIFNEYNQWSNDGQNLIAEANDLGVKTYGYLVWEKFTNKEDYKDYERIRAPNVSYKRFLRQEKVRNFTYLPYSIDLSEFPEKNWKEKRDETKPFTFLHIGGCLGVKERKNTKNVIEAFRMLNTPNTKLIVTTQLDIKEVKGLPDNVDFISKDLTREEVIKYYYEADCVVLPSKWETVGIPILESLASGVPVITTDYPPMNEFINNGTNGYLCKPKLVRYEGININVAEVDPIEIKQKMENVMNLLLLPILKNNSRYIVEESYSLEKNKKYFLDFLKKELGE